MSETAARWKKKYFDKLDEVESLSTSFGEKINVLERLLVRVSLAAEGLDSKLDAELGALRNIVRKENATARDLNRQLDVIEKQVLSMDQEREGTVEGVLQALSDLVEQLLTCDLGRAEKKALKSYGKQLRNRVNDLRQYPELLNEFGKLQGQALADIVSSQDPTTTKEGFFSRLFGNKEQTKDIDTADSQSEAVEEEPAGVPGEQETRVPAEKSPAHAGIENPQEFEPGFSAIADHVCATLVNLVEHLQLPEGMDKDVGKVRKKISSGLNWYELVPTLDDIANLVIAAFGKGQKDFESFLKSLDARLVSIQEFLEKTRQNQSESTDNKNELQEAMRNHVNLIHQDVKAAENLSVLQSTVKSNLDSILASLERFLQKEDGRESELQQEMAELQERLQSMESESREMQQALIEQQQKALTDVLTGLPNRMAYENRVMDEYERWRRYKHPLTLVVTDIDHFKRVNDKYGHLAGDKVIQLIGKEVSRRIRKTDFMARYGGEEFVILLPETAADIAFEVMDKTREMISRMPFHFDNEKVQITVSMGLSEFAGDASIDQVFNQADQALYKAKNLGRNRLQRATD